MACAWDCRSLTVIRSLQVFISPGLLSCNSSTEESRFKSLKRIRVLIFIKQWRCGKLGTISNSITKEDARTADRQIRIIPSGYYTWPEEGKANLYDSYSYWWMWVLIPLPTWPKKSQMSEEPKKDLASVNSLTAYSDFMPNLLLFKPGIPNLNKGPIALIQ